MCVCVCACYRTEVVVTGQVARVSSLFTMWAPGIKLGLGSMYLLLPHWFPPLFKTRSPVAQTSACTCSIVAENELQFLIHLPLSFL